MRGRICLISSEFLMKNELLHWNYTVLFKILKMEIAALLEAKLKNSAFTNQAIFINEFILVPYDPIHGARERDFIFIATWSDQSPTFVDFSLDHDFTSWQGPFLIWRQ